MNTRTGNRRPIIIAAVALLLFAAILSMLVTPASAAGDITVTVELLDSNSSGLIDGEVKYYSSGWKTFGTTDGSGQVQKDLPPGSYKFSMKYKGGTAYITQDINSNATVTFNTHNVTVNLFESDGSTGLAGGSVKFYASGWKTFGTTDSNGAASAELLPLNYKYSMTYLGGTEYQTSAGATVTFMTQLVTVELRDSFNNLGALPENGVVKYYARGWKDFGTTSGGSVQKELLPLSYKFSMKYGGGTAYQTSNAATVVFQTHLVTVKLKDSNGSLTALPENGDVKYYASGWKSFGTTANGIATKE